MREIKFRAWDNSEKKWLLGYEYSNLGGFSMFGETMLFNEWSSIINRFILQQKDRNPEDLILMQYTGLKDKNGKEIYEGDIVVCSYFKMSLVINLGVTEVDAELKGVINFNDLSLCVTNIVSEKWSHYTGYDDGEGSCEITYLHDVYEGSTEAEMSIEVIGNIYENPELLNQSNASK